MKRPHIILIAVVALASIGRAGASSPSPIAFLEATDEKLDPLLEDMDKNKGEILKIVNQMLDFDQLCKESLGEHWDTRSKAEQKDFSATLKALVEKNFLNRLEESKDRKVEYQSEKILGVEASVETRVSPADPRAARTEIEYKLQKTAKSWRVTDMVTDGVSLVGNYRSEFTKIITKDGWDVLMKKMKDKLAEREKTETASQP